MRDFSDFEKQQIRKIIKSEEPCIGNFIANTILVDRGIIIDRTKKEISLLFLKGDNSALPEFFESLGLIENLESERLIFIHSNPKPFKGNFLSSNLMYNSNSRQIVDPIGRVVSPISKVDIPTNVFDLIVKYVNTFYYPLPELKELVKKDFETLEKKQLRESLIQTKYSKWAFYLSLFALIFTTGYSIMSENDFKLDQNQYIKLLKNIDSTKNFNIDEERLFRKTINNKLDTLINHVRNNNNNDDGE